MRHGIGKWATRLTTSGLPTRLDLRHELALELANTPPPHLSATAARMGLSGRPPAPRFTRPRRWPIPELATGGQRPDKPPLRPRIVKDSEKRKKRSRGKKAEANGRNESPSELIAGYTPEQQDVYLRGLRILAKFAVRAHMKQKAAELETAPDEGEEGDDV